MSCLKCFTALVTKTSARGIPASSKARSRTRPAGPTNGLPVRSFLVAGLLADQHDVGALASFARHRLRGVLVERAAHAFVLCLGQLPQRVNRRQIELELNLVLHRRGSRVGWVSSLGSTRGALRGSRCEAGRCGAEI